MIPRVSLLSAIVALCVCHVISRGIQEQKTFSSNLEIYNPYEDCVEQLAESDNLTDCDTNLFMTKSATLENMNYVAYVMKIEIGSKKQEFKAFIDTGSSTTWVFDEDCKDTDPPCKNHKKFKSGSSGSFKKIDDKFEKKYGPVKTTGITGEDTIILADGFEAKKQLFGSITKTTQVVPFDGILALGVKKTKGYPPIFVNAAAEAKMEPVFSIYMKGGGSSANGGEITFGGVNKAHFHEKTEVTVKIINQGKYQFQMDKVKFGNTEFCTAKGKLNCKAYIDSGCSLIIGPKALIDPFNKNVLKGTGNGMKKEVKCSDIPSFPDLEITLGNSKLVIEPVYYTRKVGAKCYSILFGQSDRWLFGNPFFAKFYISINLKDATISFYTNK